MPDTHPLNLKVLQRHDPSIVSIIDSATYVVLYHYEPDGWKKEGVEGSMFIFRRSVSPPLGLFILNRQGLKNWTRPITFNTEFDIQGKVLMINEQGEEDDPNAKVSGLWVHDEEEGEKLLNLMSSLRSSLPPPSPTPSPPPPPPPPAAPVETNGSLSFAEILARLQSPAVPSAQPQSQPQPHLSLHHPPTHPSAAPAPPRGTELLDLLFSSLGEVKTTATDEPTPSLPAALLVPSANDTTTDGSSTGERSPLPTPAAPTGSRSGNGRRSRQQSSTPSSSTPVDDASEGGPESTPRRKTRRGHRAAGGAGGSSGQGRNSQQQVEEASSSGPKEVRGEDLEEEIVWRMEELRTQEGEEVVDRYEFVRQVMGLFRTDPAFVDRLYARYTNSSSGPSRP